MRHNEQLVIGGALVLALLLALNLIYVFRHELGRMGRYLVVMTLAGTSALAVSAAIGYRWRIDYPTLMGLGVFLAVGAWLAYRELIQQRD